MAVYGQAVSRGRQEVKTRTQLNLSPYLSWDEALEHLWGCPERSWARVEAYRVMR